MPVLHPGAAGASLRVPALLRSSTHDSLVAPPVTARAAQRMPSGAFRRTLQRSSHQEHWRRILARERACCCAVLGPDAIHGRGAVVGAMLSSMGFVAMLAV